MVGYYGHNEEVTKQPSLEVAFATLATFFHVTLTF